MSLLLMTIVDVSPSADYITITIINMLTFLIVEYFLNRINSTPVTDCELHTETSSEHKTRTTINRLFIPLSRDYPLALLLSNHKLVQIHQSRGLIRAKGKKRASHLASGSIIQMFCMYENSTDRELH